MMPGTKINISLGGYAMSKRMRQYIGILTALAAYYLVHEGAHLLYALLNGVFKQINFMGLGVQVDVCAECMTDTQLGIFCLVGALFFVNGLVFWKRVLPVYQQSFT